MYYFYFYYISDNDTYCMLFSLFMMSYSFQLSCFFFFVSDNICNRLSRKIIKLIKNNYLTKKFRKQYFLE